MSTDYNQLLNSINQNISEGVFRSNTNGFIYINKAFVRMFGYDTAAEVMGQSIPDLYKYPEDRSRQINKLRDQGAFENEEIIFLRKDRSEFIGLMSATTLYDEAGKTFWDGAIRDITKERDFINKIRSREQLLDSINRNINEAIYRSANHEGIIYINEAFVKMFGYESVDEILKLDPKLLYKNPDQRKEVRDEIIGFGFIENKEIEFRRKDGSTFWGYLNSMKVAGVDGKVYFDGAIRNVTKEKEAEQSLIKHAEMQRMLISLSTKYIDLPLEQVGRAINDSLKELGEFAQADRAYVYEFDYDNGTCSSTYEWCAENIKPEIANNQNLPLDMMPELVKSHLKGQAWILEDISLVYNKAFRNLLKKQGVKGLVTMPMIHGESCVGFVGFDWINETRKAHNKEVLLLELFSEMLVNIRIRTINERELRKLFDKTIEQNQRLKDFSYITSHNFRSSVANLVGLLNIMEDDPSNKEYFAMMKATALKLNLAIDAINDLLNFEKDISTLEKKEINLRSLVNDIILLNHKAAKEKDIDFVVDIPDDTTLKILPAYLQSILHNLITNAMKYGVTKTSRKVKISVKKDAKEVVLTVADKGRGIDLKRYGKRMFQLGSRFHADEESGHGMGLYMTKQQVEAVHGRIEVESEPGVGSTFNVYFDV